MFFIMNKQEKNSACSHCNCTACNYHPAHSKQVGQVELCSARLAEETNLKINVKEDSKRLMEMFKTISCIFCDHLDMHEDGINFCRNNNRFIQEPSIQVCKYFNRMKYEENEDV